MIIPQYRENVLLSLYLYKTSHNIIKKKSMMIIPQYKENVFYHYYLY